MKFIHRIIFVNKTTCWNNSRSMSTSWPGEYSISGYDILDTILDFTKCVCWNKNYLSSISFRLNM